MARKKKSAFDPQEHLSLHDIFLWESSFSRHEEYLPQVHAGKCVPQSFHTCEPSLYKAQFSDGDEELILRVLVELGVRAVYRDEESEPVEKVLYSLEATYAAEYIVHRAPEAEDLRAFIEFNCVHNVWSFWRQHVMDLLRQSNLPVPVVPFFPGNQVKKRTKIKSKDLLSDPEFSAEVESQLRQGEVADK